MSHTDLDRRPSSGGRRLLTLMAFAFSLFSLPVAEGQTDTTATGAPVSNSPSSDRRSSGSLAMFTGFQQGVHTDQGEPAQQADWLLGAAPNLPLGESWELSPELVLWHLTAADVRVEPAPLPPTGGKAIGEKWKWYMKLGLPVRWYPLTGGRFSAYALSGPACLLWKGAVVTMDVGAGIGWELSRAVTLTGEVRSYLYYHTSESVVLASPLSLLVGVRWRQAR